MINLIFGCVLSVFGSIVGTVYMCIFYGWALWPLAICAFIFGGLMAIVLKGIRAEKAWFYWSIASLGGALAGLIAGIILWNLRPLLEIKDFEPAFFIHSVVAGLVSGLVIGLWLINRQKLKGN